VAVHVAVHVVRIHVEGLSQHLHQLVLTQLLKTEAAVQQAQRQYICSLMDSSRECQQQHKQTHAHALLSRILQHTN
jgi:hypothetical protein